MALYIKELPVREENYAEEMETRVEPYLAELREDGFFKSFDGNEIHYEKYLIPDAEGTVVIAHGFTESAEKFREMSFCFLTMKFNVFAIDHRGHGRSWRKYPDQPQLVCIDRFETYVKDLYALVKTVVKPAVPQDKPLFLYAHSMGGAIAAQFLQTYPGVFDKAVLSAPMIQAQMPMSPGLAAAIMQAATVFGQGDKPVFAHGPYDPTATYEKSHDTSKARFDYYHEKRNNEPLLQTNMASNRWVRESARVVRKNLDPARCRNITCPLLLCQPAEDTSVVSEKENEFVSLLPDGRLIQFPNSRHEIFMSVDSTMILYLQAIEKFLKGEE